ncbi:Fructosamine kinase FrlD [Microbacterium lemovicicum]|uniref:Fructosamine kinase FrlD n=1 Tax=Microbacterium lemovicicum TaxID=1072463 RepID=A0A3Q9J4A7_9MICO|nr:PfkB family carbohydrate kinase [Microbacterium lemovicicum]AZS37526.1 Fructosamine kinase FrlD [Microbacterium lemovicicum]
MRPLPLADPRIVAVGDNVVDCYTADGVMYPGGNCVNVSVYAAREGVETSYIGAVAEDAAGDLLRSALRAENVDTTRLRIEDGSTAYCRIGLIDGDRVFLNSGKGVSLFTPSEADLDVIAGYDALHVGDSSFLDAHVPDFARRTRVSYDFSIRTQPEFWHPLVSHCFLATFSGGDLDEAQVDDLIAGALAGGARWVLVTRGSRGAVLTDGAQRASSTPVPTQVVDTLGAGDTLTARALIGLLRGEDLGTLMAAASASAAVTCTQFGAFGYGAPIDITETSPRTDDLLTEGELR